MKKVLDYGVFMRTLGMTAVNGARDLKSFLAELKVAYPPENGWQIVSVNFTGQAPEGWTFAVFLQRFADD